MNISTDNLSQELTPGSRSQRRRSIPQRYRDNGDEPEVEQRYQQNTFNASSPALRRVRRRISDEFNSDDVVRQGSDVTPFRSEFELSAGDIRLELDRIIANQAIRVYNNVSIEISAVEMFNETVIRRMFMQNNRTGNVQYLIARRVDVAIFSELCVSENYFGGMTNKCLYCRAKFFNAERNSSGEYKNCCFKGKFNLPPMSPPTELMQELFRGDSPQSKLFLKRPRFYNNHLSFASITMNEDMFLSTRGVPCLRVKGSIYHNIGSLFPWENEKPKFLQIFFHSNGEDLDIGDISVAEKNLLLEIREEIKRVNPFVRVLSDILRTTGVMRDSNAISNFTLSLSNEAPVGEHNGRYHLPTSTCVSAIILGNEESTTSRRRDFVIHLRSRYPQKISCLHSSYDPLAYVLTHMKGDAGWTFTNGNERDESYLTLMKFYKYRAHSRDLSTGDIIDDILFVGGRLMHQYWVDQWLKIEENRLEYIRKNQRILKAESYDVICAAVDRHEVDIGNWVILPSSHIGSARNNTQNFQDLLAIQRKKGKPDLFITFTCNSKWSEITENLKPNEVAWMRPDISTRVFNIKLQSLIRDICENKVFGSVAAHAYVIEFQKRGLPHSHILIWLADEDKPRTTTDFDTIVCAEIPNPEINPILFGIVTKHMIHGPCGHINPTCVCMKNGHCSKHFPKEFCAQTLNPDDGYPIYRRRSPDCGGMTFVSSNGTIISNAWVVPYNPYLSKVYNAHINVEICNTVQVLKYLFKYVYKGHDKTSASISSARNPNEIERYLEGRYVCPNESFWRIFGYSMHDRFPAVERLSVHLEFGQSVIFADGDAHQVMADGPPITTLTGFFERVLEERNRPLTAAERGRQDGSLYPTALELSYSEFTTFYTWNTRGSKKWTRRKTISCTLGRLYTQKHNSECFYLRMLLYHRTNIGSFKEMRTVEGILKESYKDVCIQLGLLADDKEWIYLFEETTGMQHPTQLRSLFAIVLVHNEVQNPVRLFEQFQEYFAEDIKYLRGHQIRDRNVAFIPSDISECLWKINDLIEEMTNYRKNLGNFGIPLPTIPRLQAVPVNSDLNQELSYDSEQQRQIFENNLLIMNEDQRQIFDQVLIAINGPTTSKLFFIDAPGGTGKTFTFNTILAAVRSSGKVAIAVASSAIAAQILVGGTTAHKRFSIPLQLTATSLCTLSANSLCGQTLLQTSLIIWDEAPMQSRWLFEAVDRSMRLLTKINEPFGGKIVVFGGDFRQVLPVIPKANSSVVVSMILKRSELWQSMCKLKLNINERVRRCGDNANFRLFAEFLLAIGENRIRIERDIGNASIQIPHQFVFNSEEVTDFIRWCYPDFDFNSENNTNNGTAILAPTNDNVDLLNDAALHMFPGEVISILSSDSIKVQDSTTETNNYPEEFLNSLTPNGFPLHNISLKVNCPIILLRNLNVKEGLFNGTRLTVTRISSRVLCCKISLGVHKGKEVLIPRISMDSTSNAPFYDDEATIPNSISVRDDDQ